MKLLTALMLSFVVLLAACDDDEPTNTTKVGIEVGNEAPDFTLKDQNGNDVSLEDYRGKTVLLEFWRTTCAICVSEMHIQEQLWQDYQHLDFVIFGVHIETGGEAEESWKTYINAQGQNGPRNWVQVIDEPLQPNVTSTFHGSKTPKRYLIDKNGIILDSDISGDELEASVKAALGVE